MTHTPEEQLKSEPAVEKAVVKNPEVLSSPQDILGKEYESNGVSFTVLGMQPVYSDDSDDEGKDLPLDSFTVIDMQSQRVPVISFQGGVACITKIQIGDEVVAGYAEIIKHIVIVEQAPEGWMTCNAIVRKLLVNGSTISRCVRAYRQSNPEWFHCYKAPSGQMYEYFSPELCDSVQNDLSKIERAPDGWMLQTVLSQIIGITYPTIERYADTYRQKHPEWFHEYRAQNGKMHEHYSPQLCEIIINEFSKRDVAEGWMGKYELAREIGVHAATIASYAENYREHRPDLFHYFKIHDDSTQEYYSPQLCDILKSKFKQELVSPSGWMVKSKLADSCKIHIHTISKFCDLYRQSNPEWFCRYKSQGGRVCEYYAPELCNIVRGKLLQLQEVPEGWMTNFELVNELGISWPTIKKYANLYCESNPTWFHEYKASTGHVRQFYAPELCDIIRQAVKDKQS